MKQDSNYSNFFWGGQNPITDKSNKYDEVIKIGIFLSLLGGGVGAGIAKLGGYPAKRGFIYGFLGVLAYRELRGLGIINLTARKVGVLDSNEVKQQSVMVTPSAPSV
jgi:hypothetical protein